MRKVYALGETVLDIIFKDGVVLDSKPGGSMLNCAISMGRAGTDVSLITEFAFDQVGNYIKQYLQKNGVDCRNVFQYRDGKTSLALAFLNERNDASYVFYKNFPPKRMQLAVPEFSPEDVVIFGSFFGIDKTIRCEVLQLVKSARDSGCLIIYDPNFRESHIGELDELLPFIVENMDLADIVRGSHEDYQLIFRALTIAEVRMATGNNSPVIIMTKSSEAVFVEAPAFNASFPVKKITPLSTIGAGDSFNAGMVYGLLEAGLNRNTLDTSTHEQWANIIKRGVDFASDVCLSYDNYISEEFSGTLKKL